MQHVAASPTAWPTSLPPLPLRQCREENQKQKQETEMEEIQDWDKIVQTFESEDSVLLHEDEILMSSSSIADAAEAEEAEEEEEEEGSASESDAPSESMCLEAEQGDTECRGGVPAATEDERGDGVLWDLPPVVAEILGQRGINEFYGLCARVRVSPRKDLTDWRSCWLCRVAAGVLEQ